jgi:hypothetical protein
MRIVAHVVASFATACKISKTIGEKQAPEQ